jgi:hypothetical protein
MNLKIILLKYADNLACFFMKNKQTRLHIIDNSFSLIINNNSYFERILEVMLAKWLKKYNKLLNNKEHYFSRLVNIKNDCAVNVCYELIPIYGQILREINYLKFSWPQLWIFRDKSQVRLGLDNFCFDLTFTLVKKCHFR